MHERADFNKRSQLPGESVGAFVRKLYASAQHGEFLNKKECIRDRLVIDPEDQTLAEYMQLKPEGDLTLDNVIMMVKQSEFVKRQRAERGAPTHVEFDEVRGESRRPQTASGPGGRRNPRYRQGYGSQRQQGRNSRCNRYNGFHGAVCPAQGATIVEIKDISVSSVGT